MKQFLNATHFIFFINTKLIAIFLTISRRNSYGRLIFFFNLLTIVGHPVYLKKNYLLSFKEHMINFVIHYNSLSTIRQCTHIYHLCIYKRSFLYPACLLVSLVPGNLYSLNLSYLHLSIPIFSPGI